ncbi:hypothetical protein [Pontibacter chitinilyticus]|uniref:hypothetical protein n=1 Tax=Pontibacter chitinilyticus TaxID=2674989 RepID=UPI00321A1601
MKSICLVWLLATILCLGASCSKEEEASPCLYARVISADNCGGYMLQVSETELPPSSGLWCGTPPLPFRYVVVESLPASIQAAGTQFTCQLEEPQATHACSAMFEGYPQAKITRICSQPAPDATN